MDDGSALLVAVGSASESPSVLDPLWQIPLPAGEPRRAGDVAVANASMFPDGRIVFAKFASQTDANAPAGAGTGSSPARMARTHAS
jgi:hypothetical protein